MGREATDEWGGRLQMSGEGGYGMRVMLTCTIHVISGLCSSTFLSFNSTFSESRKPFPSAN